MTSEISQHFLGFEKAVPELLKYAQEPWGRLFYRLVLDQLGPKLGTEKLKILDVGCGLGTLCLELSKLGHEVTGVETTEKMLAHARKASLNQHLQVRWVLGNIFSLDQNLDTETFDWVLCHNVLEYIDNAESALPHLANQIKPGGRFSLIAHNPVSKVLKKAILNHDPSLAIQALEQESDFSVTMNMPVHLRSHTKLQSILVQQGFEQLDHFGIRSINDYIANNSLKHDPAWLEAAFLLEKKVAQVSPYREIAAFQHFIAMKSIRP